VTVFHGAKRGFEGLALGKSNEAALINSANAVHSKEGESLAGIDVT